MKQLSEILLEKLKINKESSLYKRETEDFLNDLVSLIKKGISNVKALRFNRYDIEIKNDSIYVDFRSPLKHDYLSEAINSIKDEISKVEDFEKYKLDYIIRTMLGKNSGITINVKKL